MTGWKIQYEWVDVFPFGKTGDNFPLSHLSFQVFFQQLQSVKKTARHFQPLFAKFTPRSRRYKVLQATFQQLFFAWLDTPHVCLYVDRLDTPHLLMLGFIILKTLDPLVSRIFTAINLAERRRLSQKSTQIDAVDVKAFRPGWSKKMLVFEFHNQTLTSSYSRSGYQI